MALRNVSATSFGAPSANAHALYDAKKSHAPVLAITSQVPTEEIGADSFQEVDNDALFGDVAVFCRAVRSADQLPAAHRTGRQRRDPGTGGSPSSPSPVTSVASTYRRTPRPRASSMPARRDRLGGVDPSRRGGHQRWRASHPAGGPGRSTRPRRGPRARRTGQRAHRPHAQGTGRSRATTTPTRSLSARSRPSRRCAASRSPRCGSSSTARSECGHW